MRWRPQTGRRDTMRDVVILGASGHAKVCIEVLRSTGRYRPCACLAPNSTVQTMLGVPIIRTSDNEGLTKFRIAGVKEAFVALGDNHARDHVGRVVEQLGFALVTAIDPRAHVSPSARIG